MDLCFYIPAIIVTVFIPVRFGHYFVPFSKPLSFITKNVFFDSDMPTDTIFYYILVPFIIEKLNNKNLILKFLEIYLVESCQRFGLDSLLREKYFGGENVGQIIMCVIYFFSVDI